MQENLALFFFLLLAPAEIFEFFFLYDDSTRKKKFIFTLLFLVTLQHKEKIECTPKKCLQGDIKIQCPPLLL